MSDTVASPISDGWTKAGEHSAQIRAEEHAAFEAQQYAKRAVRIARARAAAFVPVIRDQTICGFPENAEGGRARYISLADALTTRFETDAHLATYCNPELERRINLAVLDDSASLSKIGGGFVMRLFVADVDCATSHKASGATGEIPAPDEWWCEELEKIQALREVHPGAYAYRTRGGYRLVGWLPSPMIVSSRIDADAWSLRYLESIAYLMLRFQIFADPSCLECTRLFRLPHATRGGQRVPEEREAVGSPQLIGTLDFELTPEITVLAKTLSARMAKKVAGPGGHKRPQSPRQSAVAVEGEGVFFHAFRARGDLGHEIARGKWAIRCPWYDGHSHHEPFDSSTVLYAPGEGETLGWVHCSHAHCAAKNIRDVLAYLRPEELTKARAAATDFVGKCLAVVDRIPEKATNSEVEAALVAMASRAVRLSQMQRAEVAARAKERFPALPKKEAAASFEKAVGKAKAQEEAPEGHGAQDHGDHAVIEVGLDLDRVVRDVLAVLPTAENLYKRDKRLERVVIRELDPRQCLLDAKRRDSQEHDADADPNAMRPRGYIERPAGSLTIRSYSLSTLARALSLIADFQKTTSIDGEKKVTPCGPSPSVLNCLLEDGEWPNVRTLVGVAEHPLVRADGTVAQRDGYDPDTGYVLAIHPAMPEIAEAPSLDDAKIAADRLVDLLSDFPWMTPADFAAWLCLPLTLVCREAFTWPAPLFATTANVRGAGKSRLIDAASLIVTGHAAARATQPVDEAETGKLLTSVAIENDPLVLFDNANRPVGGGKLDAWWTGTRWKDRLLGVSATVDLPISTVLAATGNNLSYTGDTIDRVLPVRLMSPLENPRVRTGFAIPDILGHVRQHRLEYLADVLTISRAWFAAGRPIATSRAWGSFEGWASVVPQIVTWLGFQDPMTTREGIEADDPADVALRTLIVHRRRDAL